MREQGRFVEALQALRQGHQLGSKRPGWPPPPADWVRRCERLIDLDRLLPKVLRGNAQPTTAADCLELAWICQRPNKRLHVAATRFAADAFAADPNLANDFRKQHRYHAACSAALAAAGQGEDARLLSEQAVPALRRQALTWLRADLAVYARSAKGDPKQKAAVRQRLAHWQQDAALASVRDKAIDRLPEDERAAWRQFWDDVESLRKEVSGEPATSTLSRGGAARY